MKHIIATLGCLTLLFFSSCVEEFNAQLPESDSNLLIVDGYNVIYAWDSLKEIAEFSL